MSYIQKVVTLADAIKSEAKRIQSLEAEREAWVCRKMGKSFLIGDSIYKVVQQDGTVLPALKDVQREVLKLHDEKIIQAKSRLEGLRYQLVNVAKQGGAS